MATTTPTQQIHIATPEAYLTQRLALLEREKSLTRARDALVLSRRQLPVVPVTKPYTFIDPSAPSQPLSLSDLFLDRTQLIVYHAMFSTTDDQACPSCTLLLDHIPPLSHLRSHNTNLVVVSRARSEQITAYKSQMGGFPNFRWLSSFGTEFNADYGVTVNDDDGGHGSNDTYNFKSAAYWRDERQMPFFARGEQPGHSVFVKGGSKEEGGVGVGEKGVVYHSYSTYARGGEEVMGTMRWLDMTPLGRQEGSVQGAEGVGYKRRGEYTGEDVGIGG